MPDELPAKTPKILDAPLNGVYSAPAYAELYCLSNFTFLKGASFPGELVARAHELGYRALAITDECSLAGVVRAHVAAKERGIRLIVGSEFHFEDGLHLVLLAANRQGYGELSHLISCARRETKKGGYRVDLAMVEGNPPAHCLALWLPDLSRSPEYTAAHGACLNHLFRGRLWIGVELLLRGDDRVKLKRLRELGEELDIPLCAAGGVYMHAPERRAVQDTLTAIRLIRPIAELGFDAQPNGERHLRSRERLAKLYPSSLLEATVAIAGRCVFSLDELRYEYPSELVPAGYTPHSWLRKLTEGGIRERWPRGISARNRETIEHELLLIKELGYENFFLTAHDIVRFAKGEGIYCQGRGSAANSVVCYCLGVTEVDPDQTQLLFERFLSREREEPPDIDVDFENARREEVIQHIYKKYGRHRTAIAATVISYRSKSAIRDVGKALGMDEALIDHLARSIFWWGSDLKEQLDDAGVDFDDPEIGRLLHLAVSIQGFPRHLSQHVGGFVISRGPLTRLVPIENAAMAGRTVIQWDKDDLESLGLLKVDVLALGMLTALHKAMDLVNSYSSCQYTMQTIPREEEAVYEMICKADTVGVFQIESRAQMSMLPRLRPRNYYDLVIQIAIVRPGPIEGGMVHPYLRRRNGEEDEEYESEAIKAVLARTGGVPIFQEQVMQIAIVGAGFTPGEADQLRRAMAAWKKKGGLEPFRNKLTSGFLKNGYSLDFAELIYKQIRGFGEYGFPESHSASFAHIAYVSSWFKYHHPAAFCCALLNSQPMGFYAPPQLIQDAGNHGVKVLPVDVNASCRDCTLEIRGQSKISPMLRIGFRLVKNLSETGADAIVRSRRAGGLFITVRDLVFRSGINKKDLEALAAAGALSGLSGDRHRAFWQASGVDLWGRGKISGAAGTLPMQFYADPDSDFGVDVLLPVPAESQNIYADYAAVGFTLRRHPLALFRRHLDRYRVTPAGSLAAVGNNRPAKVTGIVTARQRPQTASGVTFLTLEDETGFTNVVVWPALGEKQRSVLRRARLMGVVGHVQHSDSVTHLIAGKLVDLSHWLGNLALSSRDFV